jgi:hypothetical protein
MDDITGQMDDITRQLAWAADRPRAAASWVDLG